MPAYKSTFPVTPFSPRYMDEQEAMKRLQEEQQANNIAAPFDADFSQMDAPLSPQVLDEREKLRQKLLEKKRNNPALNEALPKKFISKGDKDGAATTLPTQTKVPVQGSRPGRDSKIKDDGVGASSVSPTVGAKPNPFYVQGPNEPSLNLPEAPNVSAGVPNYLPPVGSSPSMPQQQGQQIGVVPRQQQESEDPRAMLYARLLDRARNREMQDQDTLQRMGKARDMSALYQLAPILLDSASQMGTLQGKRSDLGESMQPFIKSLSEREMGPMMDEMSLRDKQDKRLLMQAEIASKLAKTQKGPTAPKVLPYYRPATKDQPGEILMYDQAGNLMPQQLPPGYEPNNPWTTLPPFINSKGEPVFISQNPVTGETRKLDLPNDLKLLSQIKDETAAQLKKIDMDMKVASEEQRNQLRREAARLSARMGDIRDKELQLKIQAQAEVERRNREREKIQREKVGGAAGSGKGAGSLTEGERKAGLQAGVALAALPDIESMEARGYRPGVSNILAEKMGRLGNYTLSSDDQIYATNMRALADQILRSSTGAAATFQEIYNTLQTYAVQPGDTPANVKVKNKLRRAYIDQMIGAAGRAGAGKELPPKPVGQGKKVVDKYHDKKANKTKFVYDDGTSEVVDGIR
jgi:hypothetical protein